MTSRRRPLVRRARRIATFVVAFAAGVWVCDRWMALPRASADEAATTRPATAPTTRAAATRPTLPADVAAVAHRVRAAYAQSPLRLKGTLSHDFDVAGMADKGSKPVVAALESPARFRHEASGELIVVGDETGVTVYDVVSNSYVKTSADPGTAGPTLDDDARAALAQQDPALLIAVSGDVDAVFLPAKDAKVALLPATAEQRGVDRVQTTLADGTTILYAIDQTKGTIDSVTWDFTAALSGRGAVDVKRASATLHYDRAITGGDAIPAAELAFNLPAGAREARATDPGELLADAGGDDPGAALKDKAAPDVELADLGGQMVTAVGAGAPEGDVVVLDFWATWCPPCVAGLPHVNQAAEKFKDRGVRVYACNQREDVDTVRRFIESKKLTSMTTLLDADGTVGKRYRVQGIPQTVIIGRDGKVRKVIVGFGPASAKELDEAVENAMK